MFKKKPGICLQDFLVGTVTLTGRFATGFLKKTNEKTQTQKKNELFL